MPHWTRLSSNITAIYVKCVYDLPPYLPTLPYPTHSSHSSHNTFLGACSFEDPLLHHPSHPSTLSFSTHLSHISNTAAACCPPTTYLPTCQSFLLLAAPPSCHQHPHKALVVDHPFIQPTNHSSASSTTTTPANTTHVSLQRPNLWLADPLSITPHIIVTTQLLCISEEDPSPRLY